MKETEKFIKDLTRLRIFILAFGEAPHAAWWSSQFLSPTGLSFLGRLYPRSDFSAAVRSANQAARKVHDSAIGKGGVFNILQLPNNYENQIDIYLKEKNDELKEEFSSVLTDRAKLLDLICSLVKGKTGNSHVGPLRVGTTKTTSYNIFLDKAAGAYYTGFRDNTRVYPYIEEEK